MYVLKRDAFNTLRAVAMLVVVALLFWNVGLSGLINNADAANVTNYSDTLSDSAPNVVSNHTIQFTIPNGMLTNQNFTITFPGGFNLGSVGVDDIDLATSTNEQSLASSSAAGVWGVGISGQVITFTTPSNYGVPSSTQMNIQIGTNATAGDTGNSQITNPGTGSYEIDVDGSMADSGTTEVAIVDTVLVTADVNTNFQFFVEGIAEGSGGNISATSTATATTPTTLPFETLSAGTSKTLAQRLRVVTNAAGGFVVTVEQDGNLNSATGADIDGFINGSYENTPTAWTSPTGNIADENTWGHWGITSDDTDFSATGDRWVAASTTPRAIFQHDDPADGTTDGIGSTTIGFQAQITALQEAGDDYDAVLTYIATPTF